MFKYTIQRLITASLVAVVLVGCGSSTDSSTKLSIDLTDAAVDHASKVIVRFMGMELKLPNGGIQSYYFCEDTGSDEDETILLESSESCQSPVTREIDLLTLTDGKTFNLLDGAEVMPGKYPWIRLILNNESPGIIELHSGEQFPLEIPSGDESGLKLNSGFTALINADNRFVIDFDLRKSVRLAAQQYKLRPTLRLIKLENPEKQRLKGEWERQNTVECASPMAYVYSAQDPSPDDMGGSGSQPLVTAEMTQKTDGTGYSFQINFIAFGEYKVAYTCQGDMDNPDHDDDILFEEIVTLVVE